MKNFVRLDFSFSTLLIMLHPRYLRSFFASIHRPLFVRQQASLHLEQRADHLRLIDQNETMDFHYIWLRHNCPTVGPSIHPKTGERIVDCAVIPENIRPETVQWNDQEKQLKIVWSADHSSLFDIDFLRDHAYGKNRHEAKKPLTKVENVQIIFDPNQYEKYLADCYERLKQFGMVVVRQRGLDTEAIM